MWQNLSWLSGNLIEVVRLGGQGSGVMSEIISFSDNSGLLY